MSRAKIAALNDAFRRTFQGGQVIITVGVQALSVETVTQAFQRVCAFNEFTADNDPHEEHDFGSFELAGRKFFWKIDYYDKSVEYGSEDPADPDTTARVLTLMLAEEY